MTVAERPLIFECCGDRLSGVLAMPVARSRIGVVVVVGGPQYRIGSHRQFVLLTRAIAKAGFEALRFDARGTGDSEGEARGFEGISADIAAAIDALKRERPSVERVVLWGLCDGASAALMYVDGDHERSREGSCPNVSGLVLVNPWVRSDATFATTQLRYYYLRRLAEPEFWTKLFRGRIRITASLGELHRAARTAVDARSDAATDETFQAKMLSGFAKFTGPVLLLMSGRDLTAREFDHHAASSPRWQALLRRPSLARSDIAGADHTFSREASRLEAERTTIEWLRERVEKLR